MESYRARVSAVAALMALGGWLAPMNATAQDTTNTAGLANPDPTLADPVTCAVDAPDPVEYTLPTTGIAWTFPLDSTVDETADCLPPPPLRPSAPDLFRMAALPIGETATLQKWRRARASTLADSRGPWSELLDQANAASDGNPLGMVNQWVNWHVRYQDDAGRDEWADALSTLERGAGDCEDIAVTKMALLSALGVPSDQMFLVLLRDHRNFDHAVLAVRREGAFYILDNRTDRLQPAEEVADYTPVLSFSGEFAWMYGTRL